MNDVLHPRPNPIVAAMYTLRDLDADVIIIHGPAGCGFMPSRRLEEAGVRVITSGMQENELIFGAEDKLVRTLKEAERLFRPKLVGIVGTCASMIIGENMDSAIRKANIPARVLAVETHGCAGPNTNGAIRTLEVAAQAGIITQAELERQTAALRRATLMERERGMTSKTYLEPHAGATKLTVALGIAQVLKEGKRLAVVLNAKKETAYGFADIMRAVASAQAAFGGKVTYVGNLDPKIGLPRIRRYAQEILRDLEEASVRLDLITGGLDEYPAAGDKAGDLITREEFDLIIAAGLPHLVPGLRKTDVLVTDQPRELRNYLDQGFVLSVGEISTHANVMAARGIVHSELGDTLREIMTRGIA
jgi:putative methanogenesis marker 13 metalloprotein